VITGGFLHADIIHLFFNMYALYILGSQMESFLGKTKFTLVYFISLIMGSLLSITLSTNPSVGASGAIFGLMGSMLYFGYHYRVYLGNVLKTQIVPLILINLVYGFMVPGIDNFGHIGGLIGGILATKALGVKYKSSKSDIINGIVMLLILLGFLVYMGFIKR
jgi:rhomboid protease GluP